MNINNFKYKRKKNRIFFIELHGLYRYIRYTVLKIQGLS